MGNCILSRSNRELSLDLVWTNPNPNSSFTSQSISLDLSDALMVIVDMNYNPDQGKLMARNFLPVQSSASDGTWLIGVVIREARANREAYALSNRIWFGVGKLAVTGEASDNNNVSIPLYIYKLRLK